MRTRLAVFAAIVVAAVLGFGSSAPIGAEAAGPGTWTAAAPMPKTLQFHRQVLLPNGKVFVSGGDETGSTRNGTSYLYAPATNSWSAAGGHIPRVFHTMTLLRTGEVLITGGFGGFGGPGGSILASAEVWNPGSASWSSTTNMPAPREDHAAVLLTDGRVLVVGGEVAAGVTYDPGTQVWTPTGPMALTRDRVTATLLPDGRVLVLGGESPALPATGSTEIYDPVSNTWSPGATARVPRTEYVATLLTSGKVLVAGGRVSPYGATLASAELYDPILNSWTPTGDMPAPMTTQNAILLGNGNALVTGGFEAPPSNISATAFLYDTTTGVWTTSGALMNTRVYHQLTLLHDGRALVAGGHTGPSVTASTELYDATSWRLAAPPSLSSETLSPGLLWNEKALFFDANQPDTYDADANTWTAADSGFTPAFGGISMGLVLKNGDAISIEGTRLQRNSRATNSWSIGPPLLGPDMTHYGMLLNGGKVLITSPDGTAELYDPATNTTSATGSFSIDNFTELVPLVDGRVLASGGLVSGLDAAASALVYAPDTGMWSPVADMPQARVGGAGVRLADGRVLISGGDYWHLSGPPIQAFTVANAEIFSPISNTWTVVPSMLHPRTGHKLILLPDNRVLAVGGCEQEPPTAFVCNRVLEAEVFSPSTNTWISAGLMNHGRGNAGAILLTDGNVLVAGGGDASTEIYDLAIGTDTDGDGYNDGLELALGQHPWLHCKTMRADLTGDGFVNSGDQGKLASKFGVRPPPRRIDQNGDKILNSGDQGLMASVFNTSVLMCL